MGRSGDVLEMPQLGIRIVLRRTAEETGGEMVEYDLIGRPRGLLKLEHVHTSHAEHHHVIEGALRIRLEGREHVLRAGDSLEVPPGAAHRQLAVGREAHHVRVQWRPAGPTEAFGERLASLARGGQLFRTGHPRLLAAAGIFRDFGAHIKVTRPPLAVQRVLVDAILTAGRLAGRVRG